MAAPTWLRSSALLTCALALGACGGSDDASAGDSHTAPDGGGGAAGAAGSGGGAGTGAAGAGGLADGGGDAGGTSDAGGAGGAGGTDGGGGATGGDEPPTARGETFYTAPGQPVAVGGLLDNDVDPDGDALTLTVTAQPAHGTLTAKGNGAFDYAPESGFVGEDVFTYSVDDGKGGQDTADVHVYTAATTYYVSPSGKPSNAGTSPSAPLPSLAAIPFGSLQPGDAVLLERGATFRESLTNNGKTGAAGKPLVFGAYGSGPLPVISGSDAVQGWTSAGGKRWKATLAAISSVGHVYLDGKWLTPARTPDTGFFENAAGGSKSVIETPDLTGPANAYAGATFRSRAVNWAYETRKVVGSTPGQLQLESDLSYDLTDGDWGYFLDGKLELLDAPGEWFFDATTHTLYLQTPNGDDPSGHTIEATVRAKGVDLYNGSGVGSYLVLDSLAVEHANDAAVSVAYLNHDVVLRRLDVGHSYYGMNIYTKNVDVVECDVHDTFETGVQLGEDGDRLLRSHVHDIAIVPGYGASAWGYMGVNTTGAGIVVRHNVIENVGYTGLTLGGDGVLAEENLVTHSDLILNDGGSIAFDHCDGLHVRRNIVVDAVGSLDGVSKTAGPWKAPYQKILFGIYFGNTNIENTVVEQNVAARHVSGIFVDHTANSSGNRIDDNLLFDHSLSLVSFTDQSQSACQQGYDDSFHGNTLVAASASPSLLFLQNVKCPTPVTWGTFDDNTYAPLFANSVMTRDQLPDPQYDAALGLAEWRAESGQDQASTLAAVTSVGPGGMVLHYNANRGVRRVAFSGAFQTLDGKTATSPLELQPYTGVVLVAK